MSGLGGIIGKLFSQQTPATPAQQQQVPVQPGNLPANAPPAPANTPGTDANGLVPAQDPNLKQNVPDTPLDKFKDLWEPIADANKSDATNQQLDPAKLQEIVKQAKFADAITPDVFQAVAAGGEGAIAALQTIVNTLGQQTLYQSTLASDKMLEQRIKAAIAEQAATIPGLIKKHQVSDNLSTKNPIFKNPAVKPIITALESQLAVKYPQSSATEITTMAENFIQALGENFSPKAPTPDSKIPASEDWDKFITG